MTAAAAGLSLPPTLPFWMASVAAVVAIAFGKEFFGGFGRNVFNPAIVGRAFIYVLPTEMTRGFAPAYTAMPGGLAHWGRSGVRRHGRGQCRYPHWVLRDYRGWRRR